METIAIIVLLILLFITVVLLLGVLTRLHKALHKQERTTILVIEAIGKLTQAQKSCLIYLQEIQDSLPKSDDGK